jgi:hypothetical protein
LVGQPGLPLVELFDMNEEQLAECLALTPRTPLQLHRLAAQRIAGGVAQQIVEDHAVAGQHGFHRVAR